jgi:2-phospho-L-lactate guanylyltransferase (CobY/MobA/RfbA family)
MPRSRRAAVGRSSSSRRPMRSGTNGLCSPTDAIAPGFGPASLERHLRAAEAAGASTQLVVDAALGFDLDTPTT